MTLDELQKDLDDWIDDYNRNRPHQGKRCQRKPPMETFLKNVPLAKEKILDMKEDNMTLAAQSDSSSERVVARSGRGHYK